jgi:carbon storage regulator
MLVLNRHPGESIIISDNITVTVISVNDKNIRIGVTAPREIPVHREEVYNRIVESGGKITDRINSFARKQIKQITAEE